MTLDAGSVTARLEQFGISTVDAGAVGWCLDKAVNYVCNECNTGSVPEGLIPAAIDITCGEYLRQKKLFAPEEFAGIATDIGGAGAVTVGDTSVTFKTAAENDSGVTDIDSFIRALLDEGKGQFSCFRKVRW